MMMNNMLRMMILLPWRPRLLVFRLRQVVVVAVATVLVVAEAMVVAVILVDLI